MEYRQLGRSGLRLSLAGIGANSFGSAVNAATANQVVSVALDLGVNMFDTAEEYNNGESERLLGRALGARRASAVIATKFSAPMLHPIDGAPFSPSASRRYIRYAVECSLQRLGTDWIDLYQVHWPDPTTPIEETLDTLGDLVRAGKIRYFGLSNFAAWQVVDAVWCARNRNLSGLVSLQTRWNLLERDCEAHEVPACEALGLGILPYFPLAAGLLSGAVRSGQPIRKGSHFDQLLNYPGAAKQLGGSKALDAVERLIGFSQARGHTLLELAMSWLAAQKIVGSIIAGVSKVDHVAANAASLDWQLDESDLREIDEILGVRAGWEREAIQTFARRRGS